MPPVTRRVIGVFAFVLLVRFWTVAAETSFSNRFYLITGFLILTVVPIAASLGRAVLRRPRTIEQIAWTTLVVHYSVMLAMGLSLVSIWKVARVYSLFVIPFPQSAGWILVNITALIVTVTVLALAARGLGAPCAIALSRRLATDWLYRYTRNPMVVSLIGFFLAAGLWLQSTLFLLWAFAALIPAELSFLKLYEERELELRFGEPYLAYKRSTPMLLGRRRPVEAKVANASQ